MNVPTPLVSALLALAALGAPVHAQNLLRNGSFEGDLRYWFDVKRDSKQLVDANAAHGQYALRIDKGSLQSAAFELQPKKSVTLSFFAKSVGPDATMGWQMTPCAREVGQQHGQTWGLRGKHPVKLTGDWRRYTATFTPTAAQTGLWPRPTYMLQIGDASKPILLDGISISYEGGAEAYVPWRSVEVQVNSPDLKGYVETGNLVERDSTITLDAFASNPGAAAQDITLRWQFYDYEGQQSLGAPVEKKLTLAPGKVAKESSQMKLPANGLLLARLQAIAPDGKVIDSSDLPVCSLPYPKQAAKPDLNERFGGSLWGPNQTAKLQRIGMAWTRWFPHMNWADHQKDGPDAWRWFDKELDMLAAHGFSTHAVLYGKPKWAFASPKDQLPKDMNWPANDPRWDDLTPQCAWDKFILEAVKHYKGRSLVYEIENEPELDGWDNKKDLYAKFTIRTARLIKQADPQARVMVDNVYGVPSGLNRHLLEQGGGKFIDIISWHDYHEGWLADGVAMRRMRNNLESLNCAHIEIWFNEGWAYTNTIVDEPAVALTRHTSAQSTNAAMCCTAELSATGQKKTILFHTGYETHGMSFWDYYGPGTMLWDYYGYPLPLVPAWNVLAHHIGLSKEVAWIRPEGANLCIFDDQRNQRGVIVAYADREARADVTLQLPLTDLVAEDIMANPWPIKDGKLTLSRTGRPVFLYSPSKAAGQVFADKLARLDRKNASFVSTSTGTGGTATASKKWKLPPAWEGAANDKPDGNPAVADGKPIWRLDQVYPVDLKKPENFRPLVWRNGWWIALKDTFGGQPKAELKDSALRLELRAPHNNSPGEKLCALSFIAPEAGTFTLEGAAQMRLWDKASNKVMLTVLHKTRDGATVVTTIPLTRDQKTALAGASAQLAAGDELVLLPRIDGMFSGGDIVLHDLAVSLGGAATTGATTGGSVYRLPRAWEGASKGTADNNPIKVNDQPIWRIDQVWPDDPSVTPNYIPLPWNGTAWFPEKNHTGGQPEVRVENGNFRSSCRGSWTKNEGQRIAALCFIAPAAGSYRLTATAHTKPWTGKAESFQLAILKKDTQRATTEKTYDLPRDDSPVQINVTVELTAGHELVIVPMVKDWHNATTTLVENVAIEALPAEKK